MDGHNIHEDDLWAYVATLLPSDLDDSARRCNALRRCRGVPSAEALVRLLLAYGVTDLPLKDVAAWARALGVAELSGPALFYRVRDAEAWLREVLAAVLAADLESPPAHAFRLRAVDATVITGPGARGAEWRAHVLADPARGGFCSVEITDERGGESYVRYTIEPGDVVLGDRGYAHARGIAAVRNQDAHVVVRINPQSIRLCSPDREVLRLLERRDEVPAVGVKSWSIVVPVPPRRRTKSHKTWELSSAVDWIPARVVAIRPRKDGIIWVLTTLPTSVLPDIGVMDLYRLRWQIELVFKRLKSLLNLDALPSKRGPTARSWMLSRFLAAALAQRLVDPAGALSPWGYVLRDD